MSLFFYLTAWGVEPVATQQTSWLESTGVCGVRQNQDIGVKKPVVHEKPDLCS